MRNLAKFVQIGKNVKTFDEVDFGSNSWSSLP